MPDFIPSLVLVGLAQAPLLLKLWLDHRQATSGFKLALYSKQIEIFHGTTAALNKVQQNSESMKSLIDEKILPALKDDEFYKDICKAYAKDYVNLMNYSRDNEFLYTAQMAVDIKRYNICAWKLILIAFDLQPDHEKERLDLSTDQIWKEQIALFNSITNQMRLRCGIDSLSKEALYELHTRDRKTILLLRNIEP
jgi:hypothetical protein